jgi:hypothetical protein
LPSGTANRHLNEFGEREPSTMTISVVDLTGNFKDPGSRRPHGEAPFAQTLIFLRRFQFGSPNAGDFDVQPAIAAAKIYNCSAPCLPPSINPSGWKGTFLETHFVALA